MEIRFDSREVLPVNRSLNMLPNGDSIDEGEDAVVAVALTSQPQATVSVSLDATDVGVVPADSASALTARVLEFSPLNWNVPQWVTLATIADGIASPSRSPVLLAARVDTSSTMDVLYASIAASGQGDATL